ncbi:choice-of-anchor D domain-containing protein [Halohasta salina]|uniref:choice-of-anchor D domain-containing protein n=1 Tax=Halohasta salina TaxID=2961621 RepID=UPI0020A3272C|nr:choice-of-anchor D domain-containing protein [Halohasta salina]
MTVTDNTYGVLASGTPGNWTLSNTTIEAADTAITSYEASGEHVITGVTIRDVNEAVSASNTTGQWEIRDTTIKNTSEDGIDTYNSDGDWLIQNTIIENVTDDGIDAYNSSSNWQVQDTTVTEVGEAGVAATDTTGNWRIRNSNFVNSGEYGVEAFESTGDWTVENVSVRNSSYRGISVDYSNGNWTIRSTSIQNVSVEGLDAYRTDNGRIQDVVINDIGGNGINLYDTGSWVMENTTVTQVGTDGITAGDGNATGTQIAQNVTIRDTGNHGVTFYNSSANWTVTDSTVEESANESIEAENTAGNWKITQSILSDGSGEAVNASDAVLTGNASYNYWGASDGPSGDFDGSGGAAVGNLIVAPYYTDSDLTTVETSINESTGFVDVDVTTLPGSGTETDPYIIENASELQAIEDDLTAHYELGATVDASGTAEWNGGSGFSPIGTDENSQFTGRLDGEGNVITGLSIDRSTTDNVGLFGYVGSDGLVRDVVIDDAEIRGGNFSVGGLAGINNGTVTDAVATGSVNATEEVGGLVGRNTGTITESASTTTVNGTLNIGGVVGRNEGSISTTSANSSIDGFRNVGGLVGNNLLNATINQSAANSYTNGSEHVGGLVGLNNDATISNTSARGAVSGSESVGGLVGLNNGAEVNETFATADVTGTTAVGGLVGEGSGSTVTGSYWDEAATNQASSVGGTGLSTSQMVGDAALTNMTAFDFVETWEVEANEYPVLARLATDSDGSFAGPVVNVSASSITPTKATANETEEYTVDVVIDNTSLTDESGEVDVSFENFSFGTGEDDLTIGYTDANISNGTLNVTESVAVTAPNTTGFYDVNVTDLRTESNDYLIEDGNITFEDIEVSDSTDDDGSGAGGGSAPVINTTVSSVAPNATTVNETEPYTVDVVIDNTSLTDEHGEVDVAFESFTLDTGDNLTIDYTGTDIDNGTLDITGSVNATAPATAGTYAVNATTLRIENTTSEQSLDSNNTVGRIEVGEVPDPVINETESSVTPPTVTANETEEYTVNVTVDNTTLTDESGQVDVGFENFTLETTDDELQINYTESDITEGTLNVSGTVNATAPATAGTYAVNLEEIWVDGPDEGPVENASMTIDTIDVSEPAEPVVNRNASTVAPTNVTANTTDEYTVDVVIENASDLYEEGDVDVAFDGFDLDLPEDDSTDDTAEEDLSINYTSADINDGTLNVSGTVNATAPVTPGKYQINVTDLRPEDDSDPIADANVTIETITVAEPPKPVVNETASSVTPTTASANDTQRYDVDVTIENTSLTDESGEVDVGFEAFDLDLGDDPTDDTDDEDLTINYTDTNITDGTLTVSASVNATAPNNSGTYNVSVTDLRREGTTDPDDSLIEDATISFANISVADSTEALELTLDETQAPNGTSTNLTATATLADGTTEDVTTAATLTSSDGTVVTVDNATGVVSAVGQGTALLNASYDGINATTEITVGPAEPTSLDVTLGQDVIQSDAETSVTVTAELTNGSTQDVTSLVALESSDRDVVTADNATGTVSGQGAGSANVTAGYAGVIASAPIDVTVPPLTVDRTAIDFGDVTLVNTSVAQLNVTNNASTPITVESATLTGNGSDQFAIDESAITGEIPAETNRTIEVAFEPFTRTSSNATLNLTTSDPALSPSDITLRGNGTTTNLTLTANTTSIVAGDPVRFNVTDDDGAPVNATIRLPDTTAQTGADGNATVRIETVGESTATATKNSTTTAYVSDSVSISVAAPTLSVAETSLDFGMTSLETTSRVNLTLVNDNETSVEVGAADLLGANASQFSIDDDTLPESVAANTERNVSVRYEPFERGSAAASIDVAGETVSLSGTGVAPQLNITGLPIEITAEEGSSANTTFQISNDGNAALNATLSSDNDAFRHPTDLDIPGDSSDTVDIQFAPDSGDTGTLSTELVIATESPALSDRQLTAAGTVEERSVELRQSEIDFGEVTVGSPATSTVVVDNTGTTKETLNVTTTNRTLFDVSDSADETITLAPGSSERLTIEANLTSSGVATEALQIQNDSYTSVNTSATLNATGQAPALSVATGQPVEFDDTPINSTSTAEIQLDNNGTAPLAVNLTQAFTGTEPANFSVVSESVFEVPTDDSRTVTVGFRPATAGNATANLTLDTNDIAATAAEENVTLEAAGFDANLSISGDAPEFGTVGVGGTTTQTLTVENDGESDLTLSETAATGDFAVTDPPGSIASGESEEITVRFAPDANGTQTGTLTVTGTPDNGEGTTVSTPLTGTGRYGELQVNQDTLRTGVTTTDSTTTGSVTVENVGLAGTQLSIDDISISGGNFDLDTSGLTEGDTLGSGTNDALRVRFDPASNADNGEQTGTLRLTASSSDGAKTVTRRLGLTGIVSTPEPTVSTDELSVGTVTVGDEEFRTVTVSNDGGEAFEITGTSTPDDGVTADRLGPSRIVPGGESTFVVVVNQSATGSFDTDLTVETDDDTDPTVSVTGRAVAPELSVTTEDIAFGDTGVGSADQATVTIRNTGNATLTIAEPTITGTGASEFSLLSGDRQLRIGPDSSQTVSVGFSPSDTGLSEANLQVEPLNEPDGSTRTISLNGTGTDAAAELNESAVGFGDVEQGQTVNRTLTLTNDGNAPLEVTGNASVLGVDSDAFSVNGLGTPTISDGDSETFKVKLNTTGLSRGSLGSRVVIPTDDADVTSQLGATVVAPDIDAPGTVAADRFGTTRLGTTSTAEVLVNNTGNAELNLTDLSVTGTDAAAFSVVETPDNTTVEAEDSGRVVVEFDPSALDDATSRAQNTPLEAAATLNISSNDPDVSEAATEIGLNGEAVTPSLSVPRTFQFGDVPIDQTTTGQLTVENTPSATAALNITDLEVSGADGGDYTASLSGASTPASLAPGESVTVNVNLTPSSFDQKYATLSVKTDDSRETVRKIGLSNTETIYSVSYGSINVQYINPTEGTEPTVDVDRGFRGRNATLRSVNSNVSTTQDYSLNYTFGGDPTEVGHDEALNDSDADGNVTAVQYINATTSADESKFSDSTFEVAVSKATLARGNVDPGNVTIYHENGDSYDARETELLYETTRGYVYEVTTDSYSVFAVGHPETAEQTTETNDENNDKNNDETTDDGSTGGSGGGATARDQQDDTPIADIVQDVADLTPETESESEITDTDPDRAGVTVEPANTRSVQAVTFDDETVSGTVSVKEYQPDADLTSRIESSVNADLDAAAGATDGSSSDGGDGSTASNVRLVSVTDISPSSDQATESSATVELTVERESLEDPNNAFVVHEADDGWERLETTVEETDDGTVSLSAKTDSFSLFAVVEDQSSAGTDDGGQQSETTDDATDSGTGSDSGGSSTLLLVVGILAAVAVLGAVLAVVRRE